MDKNQFSDLLLEIDKNSRSINAFGPFEGLYAKFWQRSFKVKYNNGESLSPDPICVEWIGFLLSFGHKSFLINFIGLGIKFWITFFVFMLFCLPPNDFNLLGVIIALGMVSLVTYLTRNDYVYLKEYAMELLN
ncbi:MAG: hypothetical protein IJF54_02670 [Clostridia bacterium]|nr:hypothetical protein [Clostridia bacterium]